MKALFPGLIPLPVFVDGVRRADVWCNGYIQHGHATAGRANITPCICPPGAPAELVPVGHHYTISLARLATITLTLIHRSKTP